MYPSGFSVGLSYYGRFVGLSYHGRFVGLSYHGRFVGLSYHGRFVGLSYHGSRIGVSSQRLPRCDSPTGQRDYSTTIFCVTPFIFTKYNPCGNSMVSLPLISRVRMVCPRVLVMMVMPVPSMVTRSLAGLG